MSKNLRILFVHKNPCARAYKEAVALTGLGHSIDIACEKNDQHPDITQYIDTIYKYADYDQLAEIIRKDCWDIVHCHNEPNMPTVVATQNASNCPVVYDCHDVTGLRQQLDPERRENERRCFEESDGVIMVTNTLVDVISKRYNVDNIIALPCYCLVENVPRVQRKKLPGNHLVYQGMILDSGIHPLEYRNYYPFFKAMVEKGIHVHVYCSIFNPKVLSSYIHLDQSTTFFHFHQQVPYEQLLDELGQYQWGLAAFNIEDIHEKDKLLFLNSILPNKLFDYIFSGACPIVMNNATAGKWCEKHGVGYHVHSLDEMLDVLLNSPPIAPVDDLSLISMEKHIRAVEEFYFKLLQE
ncbi:Glycosyl transferase 4-like domain-containing protein [Paucidesulfovibrio gracilis DSM 16080]|uniref:Glycosyl transferase 4-like domain-containing protein n=1 Tax=Paucidesulfovibrio gracilis DSM 16080 TaxID=1121449 RepID=A0A1T4WB68_9BACT|nr:glycosyltransferase [Paucidesulfovibrio gracilis]SKA73951.1 Glycosyl transferase 4-like domain-containing protein [Paucidesulfovibrio gracilis DSM 16080]